MGAGGGLIADGDVHVWSVAMADLDRPRLDTYAAWMTDEERAKESTFIHQRDRDLYRATCALQRWGLSRYAAIAPADWRFRIDDRGRPHVSGPREVPLVFNLSNTDGLIVLAIARTEVGIDVENVVSRDPPLEIVDQFFAPFEIAALQRLEPEHRPRRFYDLWTLKEAYLKARGVGLGIPLDKFGFDLDEPPKFHVDPELGDDPGTWTFRRLELGSSHQGALALRRPPSLGLRVEQHACVPA